MFVKKTHKKLKVDTFVRSFYLEIKDKMTLYMNFQKLTKVHYF